MGAEALAGAAAGLGALTGGIQAIAGGIQARKSKKELEALRANMPKLKRTQASREMEATARNLAGTSRLPGQSALESQIGGATAGGIQQAKNVGGSASDILGATTALSGQQSTALQNLGIQGAQMQRGAQQNLQGVLGGVSDEQYAIQDYNVLAPWRERVKETKESRAAGRQMLGSGLSQIGSAGSSYLGYLGSKKPG